MNAHDALYVDKEGEEVVECEVESEDHEEEQPIRPFIGHLKEDAIVFGFYLLVFSCCLAVMLPWHFSTSLVNSGALTSEAMPHEGLQVSLIAYLVGESLILMCMRHCCMRSQHHLKNRYSLTRSLISTDKS